MKLQSIIPIHIEKIEKTIISTGNVLPVLYEIKHALSNFLSTGNKTIIDLRAIPMAPGDEKQIEDLLGTGEISATLNSLGKSEIKETVYAGVWLVTHYDREDEMIGKFIEITPIPEIMKSQHDDMVAALNELDDVLKNGSTSLKNLQIVEDKQ